MAFKKISIQTIDDKLLSLNIIKLEEYKSQYTKMLLACTICNNEWRNNTKNVFKKKHNCLKCFPIIIKYTNEDVDAVVNLKNILRLEDCKGSSVKINFKCLENGCDRTWKTSPEKIIERNYGCAKCSNQIGINNSYIDQKLIGRNIKRIGDYVNSDTKIKFRCSIEYCQYEWDSTPYHVINRNHGCHKCNNQIKLTNNDIDEKLKNRKIKRIGNYVNIDTHIEFGCLIENCDYFWHATPYSIINQNHGCHRCANQERYTNELVDNKLLNRNIIRVNDITNSSTYINWKCLICSNIWEAIPSSVIWLQTGCPRCSCGKNEKIINNLLFENHINYEYHKYIKKINLNFTNYIVDFYFPHNNLIVEYNGAQHYQPVRFGGISLERAKVNFEKQKIRDATLENICKESGINLIWVDGRKYQNDNLKNYITNEILPLL